MPRLATSLSLSPGIASQWSPEMVLESEMTREMGREFELPKTAIAVRKFFGRFSVKPNSLATTHAQIHDTNVCVKKMNGMIARSDSVSAVSCEASLVKTTQPSVSPFGVVIVHLPPT